MAATKESIQMLIAEYFAAIRTMNMEAYLSKLAEDVLNYDPVGSGEPTKGKEFMRKSFSGIADIFTQLDLTEEFVLVAPNNEVAVKWTGRGTGKNGKTTIFEGIDIFRINDAGLIQGIKAYWEPATMLAQLED